MKLLKFNGIKAGRILHTINACINVMNYINDEKIYLMKLFNRKIY